MDYVQKCNSSESLYKILVFTYLKDVKTVFVLLLLETVAKHVLRSSS